MGNWCPYITSRGAAQSTTAGATEYIAVGTGSDLIISATEAQRQVPIRQGGTFGTLWVHIGTNATSASSTLTVRKNGADGNQTVTITSGGTGDFSDNTHTDSCTAGDKFNYKTVTGTGGALGVVTVKMDFQSSGSGAYGTFCTGSAVTYTTASATRFNCPAGVSVNTGGTNETLFEFYVRSAATLKNIAAYVSANSWATNASYISRKNGANGNLTVTITAGGTGLFESTANSDTLASGDRFCTAFVTSTGTSKSMLSRLLLLTQLLLSLSRWIPRLTLIHSQRQFPLQRQRWVQYGVSRLMKQRLRTLNIIMWKWCNLDNVK